MSRSFNPPGEYALAPRRDAAQFLARVCRDFVNGKANGTEVEAAIKNWHESAETEAKHRARRAIEEIK